MAGGSADAGAVLRALNRAYGYPLSREELLKAAEKVGSDVPFCTQGGTALANGRGEKMTALPTVPYCVYVICKPTFSISTPELFKLSDAKRIKCHPDTQGALQAIKKGDLSGLCRRLYNVFEDVDDKRMKTVAEIKGRLLDAGALGAVMTGTGSAVFGIFTDMEKAEDAAGKLRKEIWTATAENVAAAI